MRALHSPTRRRKVPLPISRAGGETVHDHDKIHDHDRGLVHDLEIIRAQMIGRRRALGWLGLGGGAAFLASCGSGGGSNTSSASSLLGVSSSSSSSSSSSTASSSSSSSSSTGSSSSSGNVSVCTADPTETAGPYPADGTNTANGTLSNVLTQSGIIRSDIRSSFGSLSGTAAGLPLTLTITLANSSAACAPLAGYAIYLWHCNALGQYSLYDLPAVNYLRGVQVTDANGQVTFQTIFPACYSGRYPHMHFEVFQSTSTASSGRSALLTSQMAMPRDIASAVYAANSSVYSQSTARLAQVTIASDNVFGDNTAAQIAAQTPSLTGSATTGYTGNITVGLAR